MLLHFNLTLCNLCFPVCSKRAFIVTDPPLFDLGLVQKVADVLEPMGVHYKVSRTAGGSWLMRTS